MQRQKTEAENRAKKFEAQFKQVLGENDNLKDQVESLQEKVSKVANNSLENSFNIYGQG